MPARVKIDVTGNKEVLEQIAKLGEAGVTIGKKVLAERQAVIVRKAKTLAPVDALDGGQLRDSIRAAKPSHTKAGRISAAVIVGGAKLEQLVSERGHKQPGVYAVMQHEDATLRHPGGGQHKFLEQPFLEEAVKVPALVQAELDKVTR